MTEDARASAGASASGPSGEDMYREHILDHYKHPRNFGVLDPADVDHEANNPLCGDEIVKMLGIPISPVRLKCALLSLAVLREGIEIYEKNLPPGGQAE